MLIVNSNQLPGLDVGESYLGPSVQWLGMKLFHSNAEASQALSLKHTVFVFPF